VTGETADELSHVPHLAGVQADGGFVEDKQLGLA